MNNVHRPALRYFGGKWNLAPWVISYFPQHDCYVEPFGGAASVLLRKPPAPIEVYNDLDGRIVNFFKVLRERPDDLINAINLTPYSRREFQLAIDPAWDPLEDARRVAVIAGQSNRGMGTIDPGGWRWMKNLSRVQTPAHDWTQIEHLYKIAERFRGVQVENDTARAVIERYDTPRTLFYVDPPYLGSTRSLRWQGDAYNCEMTDDDHHDLASILHQVEGNVILSGYPSELYDNLYRDWIRVDRIVIQRVRSWKGGGKPSTECLWIKPGGVVQGQLWTNKPSVSAETGGKKHDA
jgi:DNA adenine methylase